ncbi:hypothetical protein IR083_07115 [Dysgonomonas sp. GY75]|uniref:ATP-binding protein n=1 Tax=Dysgonomonas sp. GY75 TaxID=2780419 RepID=UPI001883BE07|nr:ATP-binding protein [Dysgonomonas sp. GY75]MBF0648584.1 hypothetical protein [Dysgonomonas sp. GY75]
MNEVTLEKMASVHLNGMLESYQGILQSKVNSEMTVDQVVAMLVDAEYESRKRKRIAANMKKAHFRYNVCMEDINYMYHRNLDKTNYRLDAKFVGKRCGGISCFFARSLALCRYAQRHCCQYVPNHLWWGIDFYNVPVQPWICCGKSN